jgi:hypothetical protein
MRGVFAPAVDLDVVLDDNVLPGEEAAVAVGRRVHRALRAQVVPRQEKAQVPARVPCARPGPGSLIVRQLDRARGRAAGGGKVAVRVGARRSPCWACS